MALRQGGKGIPHARQIITTCIAELDANTTTRSKLKGDLQEALRHMKRNQHKAREDYAAPYRDPVTPLVVMSVFMRFMDNPKQAYGLMAGPHRIADGRVAEIIAGEWDHVLPKHQREVIQSCRTGKYKPTPAQMELLELDRHQA